MIVGERISEMLAKKIILFFIKKQKYIKSNIDINKCI